MFDLEQLWLDLTSDKIGFYTYSNRINIPEGPGVYAWFYPINIKFKSREDLRKYLIKVREIQSYDSKVKGNSAIDRDFNFNWDPHNVLIRKTPEKTSITAPQIANWAKLKKADSTLQDATKLYTLAGTLFTKPIYVGLSTTLRKRYNAHISGRGTTGSFYNRFTSYMKKLHMTDSLEDLLFVCIPFANESTEKWSEDELDAQLGIVETIFKILGQPVFSDR